MSIRPSLPTFDAVDLCATCPHADTCAARELACLDYARALEGFPEIGARVPDREIYRKIFELNVSVIDDATPVSKAATRNYKDKRNAQAKARRERLKRDRRAAIQQPEMFRRKRVEITA